MSLSNGTVSRLLPAGDRGGTPFFVPFTGEKVSLFDDTGDLDSFTNGNAARLALICAGASCFSLVNGSDGMIALICPGESCASGGTGDKLPFTNGKFDRLAHPFESLLDLLGLFNDIADVLALRCPGENTSRGDLVNGIEGRLAPAFDPDENFALPNCLADSPRLS
jgi:hypothetical protein